ncbi:MAG: GreA/GreB family elongation factor [Parvibaculum sp.]|nr:GreA/GreB family elongation factor [Parvibaculum sp.]|tara:strand:+ start:1008 stop:1469 length:462 start_codon:yes stop_codon:yes gene_type:complete
MSATNRAAHRAATEPILSANDFARLEIMLCEERGATRDRIRAKIDAATVVSGHAIAHDIATIGSILRYRIGDGPIQRRTLALPDASHPNGQFISLMTPVGMALLGNREGACLSVTLPDGGTIMLELLDVEFQPEAEVRRRSTWVPDDNGPSAA